MLLERKISQLKELPELQPDKKWKATTKFEVLGEISSQNRLMKALQLSNTEKADLFMMKVLRRLVPSATKVIAGFLVIFLGTGLGFVAQASVPGEPLWPIKRTIEQAELTFTLSSVRETEVHVKHVGERVKEIGKIINEKSSQSSEVKERALKKAVVHLEKDVKSVDTSLKVVREDKKPIEVVELAKKVKEATDITKSKVETIKTNADSDSVVISDALENVEKLTIETESTVLNIAVEVHDQVVAAAKVTTSTPGDLTGTSTLVEDTKPQDTKEVAAVKAVVNEIISTEIEQLSNKIAATKGKAEAVSSQQIDPKTPPAPNTTTTPSIQVVKDELDEAEAQLNQAKSLLQEGDVKQAVDKVVKSQTVNTTAKQAIKQLTTQAVATEEKPPVTTTSTLPLSTTTPGGTINMQNITTTEEFMDKLLDGQIKMKLEQEIADEVKNNL